MQQTRTFAKIYATFNNADRYQDSCRHTQIMILKHMTKLAMVVFSTGKGNHKPLSL